MLPGAALGVATTVDVSGSGAGDAVVDVAVHARDRDVAGAGDVEVHVILDRTAVDELGGAADVDVDGLAGAVAVGDHHLAGAGDVDLDLTAKRLCCDVAGAGDVELGSTLDGADLDLNVTGSVRAERPDGIGVDRALAGSVDGQVALQLAGDADVAEDVLGLDGRLGRNGDDQQDLAGHVDLAAVVVHDAVDGRDTSSNADAVAEDDVVTADDHASSAEGNAVTDNLSDDVAAEEVVLDAVGAPVAARTSHGVLGHEGQGCRDLERAGLVGDVDLAESRRVAEALDADRASAGVDADRHLGQHQTELEGVRSGEGSVVQILLERHIL